MDRRMRVKAKLCQSMMKVAPCLTLASQHSGSVGMAGGTCAASGPVMHRHGRTPYSGGAVSHGGWPAQCQHGDGNRRLRCMTR